MGYSLPVTTLLTSALNVNLYWIAITMTIARIVSVEAKQIILTFLLHPVSSVYYVLPAMCLMS